MKRTFISLTLALALILSLSACSGDNKPNSSTSSVKPETSTSNANKPSSSKTTDVPDTPLSEFTYEYSAEWGGIVIIGWESSNSTLRVKIPSEIEGQPVVGVAYSNNANAFMTAGVMEVILPETLTHIGQAAFQNSAITKLVLPESAQFIGNEAFSGCVGITSFTIPKNVTELDGSFRGSHLTELIVDSENTRYSSVDGVLFDKDQKVLIQYPMNSAAKEYSIPDGTEVIGAFAFELFAGDVSTELEHLIIPDSVVSIKTSGVESIAKFSITYQGVTYSNQYTEDGAGLKELYEAIKNLQ